MPLTERNGIPSTGYCWLSLLRVRDSILAHLPYIDVSLATRSKRDAYFSLWPGSSLELVDKRRDGWSK
jgi:hypothetical protein